MSAVKPTKKQFKCEYCTKFLASKASLKNHVTKIHESKKPEKECDVLKNNVEQPSTSKTFSCETCKQKFATKASVKKHTETLHEGKKCTVCNIPFANMAAHEQCFKTNPFPCRFCQKWLETEEIRKVHQMTHNLTACAFCLLNVETEKFDSHLKVCQKDLVLQKYWEGNEKPKENELFMKEKLFSDVPKTTHNPLPHPQPQPSTSETAFSCNLCNKEFASNESLKKHTEKVHEAKVSMQQSEPSGLKVLPSQQELQDYHDNQLRGIINEVRPDYHSVMRYMDVEYTESAKKTKTKTELLEKKVEDYEKILSIQQNYQPIYFEEIPIATIDYQPQETFQCDDCELHFAAKKEFFDNWHKKTNIQINYVCPHKVKIDFTSEVHEEEKTPEFETVTEPHIDIHPAENETETQVAELPTAEPTVDQSKGSSENAENICTYCERTYKTQQILKRHMKKKHSASVDTTTTKQTSTTKKKSLSCPMCSKMFSRRDNLSVHISAVHEGKKPFKCDTCGKCFSEKGALKKHVDSVHDENKPHKEKPTLNCHICGKKFTQFGHVRTHISSVHENSRQFECTVCQKTFSEITNLTKHIARVHEKKKPFICTYCPKAFGTKSTLKNHEKTKHEKKN